VRGGGPTTGVGPTRAPLVGGRPAPSRLPAAVLKAGRPPRTGRALKAGAGQRRQGRGGQDRRQIKTPPCPASAALGSAAAGAAATRYAPTAIPPVARKPRARARPVQCSRKLNCKKFEGGPVGPVGRGAGAQSVLPPSHISHAPVLRSPCCPFLAGGKLAATHPAPICLLDSKEAYIRRPEGRLRREAGGTGFSPYVRSRIFREPLRSSLWRARRPR